MPRITKSLWRYIFDATHRVPASTDLIGYADHTGTPMVSNINECTVAELVAAGIPSGSSLVKSATVTLTNAQIIALSTTPIDIIPAPSPTQIVFNLGSLWEINLAAGGDYTGIDANGWLGIGSDLDPGDGDLNIANDTSFGCTAVTDFLTNAPQHQLVCVPGQLFQRWLGLADLVSGLTQSRYNAFNYLATNYIGRKWQVQTSNAMNFGGGNVGNHLKVTAFYLLVDAL